MGVIHLVIPLGDLNENEVVEIKKHLAKDGLEYPPDANLGHFPSQYEIEEVLRSFKSHEAEYSPITVDTNAPWDQASLVKHSPPGSCYTIEESASLNVGKTPADKISPCNFYLSKGDLHLNYAILERLAHQCGPLYCITEGEYDGVIFHRKQDEENPPPSFAQDHHAKSKTKKLLRS